MCSFKRLPMISNFCSFVHIRFFCPFFIFIPPLIFYHNKKADTWWFPCVCPLFTIALCRWFFYCVMDGVFCHCYVQSEKHNLIVLFCSISYYKLWSQRCFKQRAMGYVNILWKNILVKFDKHLRFKRVIEKQWGNIIFWGKRSSTINVGFEFKFRK